MHTATQPAVATEPARDEFTGPRSVVLHPAFKYIAVASLAAGVGIFALIDRVEFSRTQHAVVQAALGGAVRSRDEARTDALLRTGVNPNPDTLGGATTPLLAAVQAQPASLAVVRSLLAHGANPNAAGALGETPLGVAAARGDETLCRLLVAAGARTSELSTERPAWAGADSQRASTLAMVRP